MRIKTLVISLVLLVGLGCDSDSSGEDVTGGSGAPPISQADCEERCAAKATQCQAPSTVAPVLGGGILRRARRFPLL